MPKLTPAAIQVSMIGHASLLIETENLTLYCDPVFIDPHHDGLFEIYPPRRIVSSRLPPASHIFVSHRHFDHFDLPTLAMFERSATVLMPEDELIESRCRDLGFENIVRVRDWDRLDVGDTSLTFTPSKLRIPEHGVVLSRGGTAIWNQVDTYPSEQDVDRVHRQFGTLAAAIVPWSPLMMGRLQRGEAMYPGLDSYEERLTGATKIVTRALLPGACGFRHAPDLRWQDHVGFPVTRERCLRDLAELRPDVEIAVMDPGDRLTADPRGIAVKRGRFPAVKRLQEWASQDLLFSPVLPDYHFDLPSGAVSEKDQRDTVDDLARRIARTKFRDRLASLLEWAVIEQLHGWDGRDFQRWVLDFSGPGAPEVRRGFDPLANVHAWTSFSVLQKLLSGEAGWDFILESGAYRSVTTVSRVGLDGIEIADLGEVIDPLYLAVPFSEAQRHQLDRAAAKAAAQQPQIGSTQSVARPRRAGKGAARVD